MKGRCQGGRQEKVNTSQCTRCVFSASSYSFVGKAVDFGDDVGTRSVCVCAADACGLSPSLFFLPLSLSLSLWPLGFESSFPFNFSSELFWWLRVFSRASIQPNKFVILLLFSLFGKA